MVFTSYLFLFYFLPFVLLPYLALAWAQARWPGTGRGWATAQNGWLLATSYVFYGWCNPWFVLLMLGVTALNYACGRVIAPPGASVRQRWWGVTLAIVLSLGLLGFFKYWVFLQTNWNAVLALFSADGVRVWRVVLPIGISFYIFHALSYAVDVWRGTAPVARSFTDFACYIALFPQSVAGPIIRYNTVAHDLRTRTHSAAQFASGTPLFMLGFGKKILLANPVGEIADAAFRAESLSCGAAWWGAAAYALQLYFDFCGYSDMAVGLGRMFGFEFPKNFHTPYCAESITDFWRRWHISLSTFLRDYLYLPLGGNRRGPARTYANLLLVMLLGGLWHGANWTFLAWGAWHGGWLAFERWRGKTSLLARIPAPVRVAFTLLLVLLGWVVFRAPTFGEAGLYLRAMFGGGEGVSPLLTALLYGGAKPWLLAGVAWLALQRREAHEWSGNIGWGKALLALAIFLVAVLTMFAQSFSPFLYFQF